MEPIIEAFTRADLAKRFVSAISEESFTARYRRKELGRKPLYGWPERLEAYFWPNPDVGYLPTMKYMAELLREGEELALSCGTDKWDYSRASAWAHRVFTWGRVPQPKATEEQVRLVFKSALGGQMVENAPMNSGWTKVAAFATAHLEAENQAQAICDSRVCNSIVSRLDRIITELAPGANAPPACLKAIGKVLGRNGARGGPFRIAWPSAYRKWASHFATAEFVRAIRDTLNEQGVQAKQADGTKGAWTVRMVEMVLFMDGYEISDLKEN